MEPKYNFSYKWTQPYTLYRISANELDSMRELFVENMLADTDFEEAKQVIAKIMAL